MNTNHQAYMLRPAAGVLSLEELGEVSAQLLEALGGAVKICWREILHTKRWLKQGLSTEGKA